MSEAASSGQIPRRLAEALIMGMHGRGGMLQVGRPASDLPAMIVPNGYVAIGAMVRDAGSTSVFATPLSAAHARQACQAQLVAAGYEEASLGGPSAGFVSDEREHMHRIWCRGSEAATLATCEDAEPGSVALITVQRSENGPCSRGDPVRRGLTQPRRGPARLFTRFLDRTLGAPESDAPATGWEQCTSALSRDSCFV